MDASTHLCRACARGRGNETAEPCQVAARSRSRPFAGPNQTSRMLRLPWTTAHKALYVSLRPRPWESPAAERQDAKPELRSQQRRMPPQHSVSLGRASPPLTRFQSLCSRRPTEARDMPPCGASRSNCLPHRHRVRVSAVARRACGAGRLVGTPKFMATPAGRSSPPLPRPHALMPHRRCRASRQRVGQVVKSAIHVIEPLFY